MINKHPDKITYWKIVGVDHIRQPIWDGPHVANCRWEDEQRLYLTSDGREARGRSTIFTKTSIMDLGDYAYFGVSDEPTPPTGSYEVKQPRRIANLRGTKVEYRYIV